MTDLVISRNFPADPATVFAFVTQEKHLTDWFGPEGMTVADHQLDLTKTGAWRATMMNADGQKYKVSGEVTDVSPPDSVEFTWGWHDEQDERGGNSIVRIEVKSDNKGGTEFRLVHTGLVDQESADNHNVGWSSSFVKLERMAK
ncbi:Aha1 domain protein [Rhodobacterales bacterium HTCC2150]|jgi:uncharacterized protein YndB with AHSA1/START domain|nr:Aha1 domain protein [Rhodobacterales bacterium HTCC2150] [Rhodobacteraceae bacterium HTCC2150]